MAAKKKNGRKATTPKGGERLLDQVVRLTGLPSQAVKRELKLLLDKKNIDVSQLTLEQLRAVVACYLREIMMGILDRSSGKGTGDRHH